MTELRYDPQELRRVIAVSFSVGELRDFAGRYNLPLDHRVQSSDDIARELVRTLDARSELPQLVKDLEAEKPLVVWPEPKAFDAAEPSGPLGIPPGGDLPSATQQPLGADESRREPDVAPDIPAPGPRHEPALQALVDPYLAGENEDKTAAPKTLLVAAALVVGLSLGILGMWLAFRGDDTEPTAAEAGPVSPAAIAAASLRGTVAATVETCEAELDPTSARDSLSAAFEHCSRPEMRSVRPNLPPAPAPQPRPGDRPQPRRVPRPAPAPAQAGEPRSCLDACFQARERCNQSKCGSEPTSASEYPQYQKCLSECMTPYLRCRLACR